MKFKIISAMLVLALASLACSFTINLPETATPGPDLNGAFTDIAGALQQMLR